MKRILIIDSMNRFVSSFIKSPYLTNNGEPVGGAVGFLLSLQKYVNCIKPDVVISVFDCGNSKRRRLINKNYKQGRKPYNIAKKNWAVELNEHEQDANKLWQLRLLFDFIDDMPIYNFCVESAEADDIISYIAQKFVNDDKVILSSDKDFVQLLDNKTLLYRPTQNEVLNTKRAVEKYGIHPNNWVLARSLTSDDKSDNIKGVKGVGLKTVANRFSFLKEEKQYLIPDIINECRKVEKKLKVHENILQNEEKIYQNYKISQLTCPSFSVQDKHLIDETFKNQKLIFKKFSLIKKMLTAGINGVILDNLFMYFNKMTMSI